MIRSFGLILSFMLLPAASRAARTVWTVETPTYRLFIQEMPLGRIPEAMTLSEAENPDSPTQEEGIAIGASMGNRLFRHLEERQDSTYWYPMEFEPVSPQGRYDGSAALIALPSDSSRVPVREIIFCPVSVSTVFGGAVYHLERGTAWKDVASHKGKERRYLAYAGFPRVYNPEKLIGIVIHPRGAR
jgi:hypothetical protein